MSDQKNLPFPLDAAVSYFFPNGGITKNTLRAAIRKGELECEHIGNKYFVTASDIEKWREKLRKPVTRRYNRPAATGTADKEQIEVAKAALRHTAQLLISGSKGRQARKRDQ
ncbi:helix-turn-helix domain-containing protein [Aestuariivirga sp.]|uniref:helix-turn-helix domain-containing protein n=1 Tax=Aestuariivirga sp. TaxID=2650926 RepID=UPI0039E4FF73